MQGFVLNGFIHAFDDEGNLWQLYSQNPHHGAIVNPEWRRVENVPQAPWKAKKVNRTEPRQLVEPSEFDLIYDHYGRRGSKPKARAAWNKLPEGTDIGALRQDAEAYCARTERANREAFDKWLSGWVTMQGAEGNFDDSAG